jgi:glycerophosphoryl diester phosphodiesterase
MEHPMRETNQSLTPILFLLFVLILMSCEKRPNSIQIVAHRGANEFAPENTRAAARLCVEWGLDYVEIDVRASKDSVYYILHDEKVNRTTNGTGKISALTAAEIDTLDAGSWFDPKFAGERIPRLEPYLNWIKGKAKVFLDVKGGDLKYVIEQVHQTGLENDCFFWFGDDSLAVEFRKMTKKLALKINVATVADVENAVKNYQANIVEFKFVDMTPELIEACRKLGIKSMCLQTEKNPEAFKKIIELKPDMVNLNHGDLFLSLLQAAEVGDSVRGATHF